jgi:hypothetical protein
MNDISFDKKGRQAMKKLLSIILMASMIVTLTPIACGGALTQSTAFAEDSTYTDDSTGITYTLSTDDDGNYTATVSGCSDTVTSVTIPESVQYDSKTYNVTAIADYAIYIRKNLTSVTIAASVKSIGDGIFLDCPNLTSIAVNENNSNFSAEEGVIFDKNKTTLIKCAEGKTGTYTIPSTVTTIKYKGFANAKLEKIIMPSRLTDIGDDAFSECTLLATFEVDSKNASFCADNGVLFSKDKSTLVCYPIGKADTSYTVPDEVKYIGKFAFQYSNLTNITIPEGVEEIKGSAFYKCRNLANITIPASVTKIAKSAFGYCESLERVTFEANSKLTNIGSRAFYTCKKLNNVVIPAGVTCIEEDLFSWCEKLTSITIPEGVTEIKSGAFARTALTIVTIPASLVKLNAYAFENCSTLKSVIFAQGSRLEEIAGQFYSCLDLKSITIPESIKKIGQRALYNVEKLLYKGAQEQWDALNIDKSKIASGDFIIIYVKLKPELESSTLNSIIIKNVSGAEYSIDNTNWQDSPEFTGLASSTEYTFYIRYKNLTDAENKELNHETATYTTAGNKNVSYGGSSRQHPTVAETEHGTITLSSNGRTATITPDAGYEIASVTINGEDKGVVSTFTGLWTGDKIAATFQKTKATLDAETKAAVASLSTLKARSSKTSKGNIKVIAKLSTAEKQTLAQLADLGYTVKYRFYRSTKRSADYKAMLEGTTGTYINTTGEPGTRYYYKCRVMVYDANGTLVAKTELKNCKYACRKF